MKKEDKKRISLISAAGLLGAGVGSIGGESAAIYQSVKDSPIATQKIKNTIKNFSFKNLRNTKSSGPISLKKAQTFHRLALIAPPSVFKGGIKEKKETVEILGASIEYLKKRGKYRKTGALMAASALGGITAAFTKQANRIPVTGGRSYNKKDQVANVKRGGPVPQEAPGSFVPSKKSMKSFVSKKTSNIPGNIINTGLGSNPAKKLSKGLEVKKDKKGKLLKISHLVRRKHYGIPSR